MVKIKCDKCKNSVMIFSDSERFYSASIGIVLQSLGKLESIDGWFLEIGKNNIVLCPNCRK